MGRPHRLGRRDGAHGSGDGHDAAEGRRLMAATDTQAAVIGYASIANKAYTVRDSLGTFLETVAPGAFRGNLLTTCDCRYLFNHEGMALARNTAGTLDL